MKPLTIDELKALEVGDWVWIVNKANPKRTGYFEIFDKTYNSIILFRTRKFADAELFYTDYGKTWLAYKNKEQAEAKGEIVEFGIPFFSKHFNAWCVFERVDDYVKTVCITEEQAAHRLAELKGEA